ISNLSIKKLATGITWNIFILGIVSLVTDLSSQMIFPLIPLYLTSLGAGAYIVGLVEGAAETTTSLLKIFSGYWSDKIKKRKPFVVVGYTISSLVKPLFAFANTWPLVLIIRSIERIGKGMRDAPRDAIVAESVAEEHRGKAFGFHRTMDGLGSVLGAVFSLILFPILGYKKIFLATIFPGILAIIVLVLIKEKRPLEEKIQKPLTLKVSFKSLPKNLKLFIVAATIFALGHFGYAFLLLKAKNIGLTDSKAIILYVIFYMTYTLFATPAGMLSDKFGRKKLIMIGYALFAALSLGLIFPTTLTTIIPLFVIYGIFYSIIDGVQRAFVADLSPEHLKGTALGTFHTFTGLVALPGGFFAGMIWDKIGPNGTFIYGSILAVLALIMFSFVRTKQ
ncbi:MAG: MFS transporter, partial [Candidatus Gracilibacteria bacterium]